LFADSATRVPGAAQHEVVRCRPGTVTDTAFGTVPDQRCIVSRFALTLHRIRDTSG
jgi:hypothetical protein